MKKIILALDEIENLEDAVVLVKKIGHLFYAIKIHNLYDKFGPEAVRLLKEAGAEKVWVDFKIYDIPNTAKLRALNIFADIVSVHASGGVNMMKEAVSSGVKIFLTIVSSTAICAVAKGINNKTKSITKLFFFIIYSSLHLLYLNFLYY